MFYNVCEFSFKRKMAVVLKLGPFTEEKLERVLKKGFTTPGEKIVHISELFLGTPYVAHTLPKVEDREVLIVNFEGMDCMTFIEYVEALRLSKSWQEFEEALKRVRYKDGTVNYSKRKHFFSDWILYGQGLKNVTESLKKDGSLRVRKILNLKKDKTLILPGVQPEEREIVYLPSERIDAYVIHELCPGDYIGFYTSEDGLDCSHTGIFIKMEGIAYIRHASSSHGKILDEEFLPYASKKEGIIVLRPR